MADYARLHVLAIDDDADTRANLKDILELDNCRVDTAASAAEALDRHNWADYAAVIVDWRLPDVSAAELLPRFKSLAPEAAVIVVTGYADLQAAIVALRQGAADYILKPIKPEELRARLAHIAARKRADADLREAQQRAVQAERLAAIGQTVTSMAHESRNALQRIQAALEMLAPEVQDRPAALEYVADIQKAEDGLLRLYEQLRRYAAPVVLNREKSHLGDILQEAWFQLLGMRKGRDARLQEHGAEIDLDAAVDWFAVGQVFRNILENSLAACADPVVIDVRWAESTLKGRPAVRVEIQDNGPGLTAEQKQRIFEAFFTTKRQGTGLGMAIAKNVVDSHGGQILVGPGAGRGTEIVMVLPQEIP